VDEWNSWYRKHDLWQVGVNPVEERYNLSDALWVASALNLFQRRGDKITMACLAQMLNSIGAIFTNPSGMFLQTTYFPMKLYRNECGGLAVRTDVQSPSISSRSYKDVPYLDVSSTLDKERNSLSIAVVNRHEIHPIRTSCSIRNARVSNQATVFEINGRSPKVENSFSEPANVNIRRNTFVLGNAANFQYTFPAHSVTLLKLTLV
jgi:alpha-N-arabinofuranosidase